MPQLKRDSRPVILVSLSGSLPASRRTHHRRQRNRGIMKRRTMIIRTATLALAPAAIFTLTSCSSSKQKGGTGTEVVETSSSATSVTTIRSYTTTAKVTGIDSLKRTVTLATSDGKKTTVKAGPEVANFNQI